MPKDIFDKLDWNATGGHPDHGTPDPIFREAADKILLLRARLADCERSLQIYDGGGCSEYWLRYEVGKF